jgi:hypothetical protein
MISKNFISGKKACVGRNWIVILQTYFSDIEFVEKDFVSSLNSLLYNKDCKFVIYRIFLAKNSKKKKVMHIKFYVELIKNYRESSIYRIFTQLYLSEVKDILLKTKLQGSSLQFIESFISECDVNDYNRNIFWVGENRYNSNKSESSLDNLTFVKSFGLVDKALNNCYMPDSWLNQL